MGRGVQAPVTYWTGIWEPHREAISKEVALIRQSLAPRAPVVSFSRGQRSTLAVRDRVVRLSADRYLLLRALAAILERRSSFNHVVGDLGDWHLLRSIGRRPALFTAVVEGEPVAAFADKAACFVAESEVIADQLVRSGVAAARVEIVYPGVDLGRYRPTPFPDAPVRVLFASSPGSVGDFEARGVPVMVEAARACPEIELVLLWRRWGQLDACVRAFESLRPPANVRLDVRDVGDMAAVYAGVHATIFVPARAHGKSCPNSVVEGLACGRPTLVAAECGIAGLIGRHEAGVVLRDRSAPAAAEALRELAQHHAGLGRQARELAERHFGVDRFLGAYRLLYERMQRLPADAG
jgi:glycosyltransferase involved in cell wall biosynthesis